MTTSNPPSVPLGLVLAMFSTVVQALGQLADEVDALRQAQQSEEKTTMAGLQDLQTQVTRTDSVMDSAVVLLTGLAQELQAAKDDPAKLDAVISDLGTRTEALAQAISANTPAASPGNPTQSPTPAPSDTGSGTSTGNSGGDSSQDQGGGGGAPAPV